ncbi:MAG: hypothetical protein AAF844_08280 [Pseudomonadota bacterium]
MRLIGTKARWRGASAGIVLAALVTLPLIPEGSRAVAASLDPVIGGELASLDMTALPSTIGSDSQPAGSNADAGAVRVAGFGPPLVLLEEDGPLAGSLGAQAGNTLHADRMLALAAFLAALCLMRLTAMRVN